MAILRHLVSQSKHPEGSEDLPVEACAGTWGTHIPTYSSQGGLPEETQLKSEVISQAWEKEFHIREDPPRREGAKGSRSSQGKETAASLGRQARLGGVWRPLNRIFLNRELSAQ